MGSTPLTFSEWLSPDGTTWSLPTSADFPFCPTPLLHALQDQAGLRLWAGADTHFNEKGIRNGIEFEYTLNVLRKFRKESAYDKAAALETILCGACWSPQRKYEAGLIPEAQNICLLCDHVGCDDYHQFGHVQLSRPLCGPKSRIHSI